MFKLTAGARFGKKMKIDYDDMGRPLYNSNGKALQSYIGAVARSMVPINIKSWPSVPENIKQKVWEEITNIFEIAPQSEATVMSSAGQKWRDFKNKLTSRFIWPNRDSPENLCSPPGDYAITPAVWKEFVDERLHPSWQVTHEKQKERTMHCKYHHKLSRKGYIDLEAELLTNGVGKEGSTMSHHIASQLKEGSRESICLIPYNTGYHWILTVINKEKNMIYVLDSMGNRNREEAWKNIVTNGVKIYNAGNGIPKGPGVKQLTGNLKQRGGVECGYCVMLYMKEIVESEGVQLEKKYGGSIKNQYYNQTHYDEVRNEWSEFVYSFVGA